MKSFNMEGYREWKAGNGNVKKTLITGAVLALGLGVLINPHIELPKRAHVPEVQAARIAGRSSPALPATPKPDAKTPPVVLSDRVPVRLDPVVIAPPVDPWAAWFGSYTGDINLPHRGQCHLTFAVAPVAGKAGAYSGASELSCFDVTAIAAHQARGGPMATTLALNPTRAVFEGAAQDGALVFHAVDNIIQPGTFKACEMVSVSERPFMEKKLSAKWQEKQSESGICGGGELILSKH
jgi:hypothetical protein